MLKKSQFAKLSHYTVYTVGSQLSESPLSKHSVIWMLHISNFIIQKDIYFSTNQVINEMPLWFLDFISLLCHNT